MNKKNLIIIVIILAIILVSGFFVYKYLSQIKGTDTQNSLGGANVENPAEQLETAGKNEQNPSEIPQVQIQANGGNTGGLIICADKCGDNVCQKTDPKCEKANGSLNCICPETPQECPQDCK